MPNANDPDALSQALAEPSRRAILENLRFGRKSVTELVQATHLKQPNVSNHLAKMRLNNIVRAERIGRQIYYSIALPLAEMMLRLHDFTTDPLQLEPAADGISPPDADMYSSVTPGDAAEIIPAATGNPYNPSILGEYQHAFFQNILVGREERAIALVNAMLARRIALTAIYKDIFQWALYQIGERVEQGLTDEAHEHMASAIIERMMAKVSHFYTPMHRAGYKAVLGCVAGNWHTVGLRMLSDSLNELGWETAFLGANVPSASFFNMIASWPPDLVVISCAMEDQVREVRHLVMQLSGARQSLPTPHFQLTVGGQYYLTNPERLQDLPLDFTAMNLTEFLDIIRARFPGPARKVE